MSTRFTKTIGWFCGAALVSWTAIADSVISPGHQTCRHPVALALNGTGTRLLAANERTGTISIIDTATFKVLDEVPVARRLSHLRALPDGRHFLTADPDQHQLILLGDDREKLEKRSGWPVAPHPVHVQINEDGSLVAVAGLWSQRCQIFRVNREALGGGFPAKGLELVTELALPFPPRRQLFLEEKLIVTAAFGGHLAVIDIPSGRIDSVRELEGHNIRGLAFDEEHGRIVLTHQILDSKSATRRSDVQWGFLMTNNLKLIPQTALLDPTADLNEASQVVAVGSSGDPAGDPDDLLVLPDGRLAVSLAGRGEVAIMDLAKPETRRFALGKRVTGLVADKELGRVYAAVTFSDAVAFVEPGNDHYTGRLRLGPRRELSMEERGEHLFHDAGLSFHGWFSCHSCHTDGHSNGLLNDNEGDDSFGAPKRILSLLGAGDTEPWGWNGGRTRLEDQVRKSILSTMHGPVMEEEVQALAAYLRTLPPPPAPTQPLEAAKRGKQIFAEQRCHQCHDAPHFTSPETYRVGLIDELGQDEFNPPSLRGVRYRARLFHDNRADGLEAVFREHRHKLRRDLSDAEVADLAAYLRSL